MGRNLSMIRWKHILNVSISTTVCCLIVIYTPIIIHPQKTSRDALNWRNNQGIDNKKLMHTIFEINQEGSWLLISGL